MTKQKIEVRTPLFDGLMIVDDITITYEDNKTQEEIREELQQVFAEKYDKYNPNPQKIKVNFMQRIF